MTRLARAAIAATIVVATPAAAFAQSPLRHWTDAIDSRFAMSQPVISYTLRVDSADVSGFNVSMSVRGARDTVLLAMATHPEYDDKYWRFVRDVRVESPDARATVARVDSALWRVVATGGAFTVHYRLALPAAAAGQRQAWRPFLSADRRARRRYALVHVRRRPDARARARQTRPAGRVVDRDRARAHR